MMKAIFAKRKSSLVSLLYAWIAIILISSMLLWPRATYEGARFGLEVWGTVLVPSLLPFFIAVDILINLGIVRMLGILLEPVMRPIFNLPGSASFVLAMGFTSGFPMGAVITRRLYEEKLCLDSEAERLIAFTNNSSPLFILVAVAVGMFSNPSLGLVMMASHYLANILLGIGLGFTAPRRHSSYPEGTGNLLVKGIRALLAAQQNRKPVGRLFGDAIRSGINTILLIGGFVIIYALIIKLLYASGLMAHLSGFLASSIHYFGFDHGLGEAISVGFFEITLGLKVVSGLQLSFLQQAVVGSIILGWSGLCIQSQVISVLAGSGIRAHLYLWGRLAQSILSGLIAYFLAQTTDYWGQYFIQPASAFPAPPAAAVPCFTFSMSYTIMAVKLVLICFTVLIALVLLANLAGLIFRPKRQ